MPGRWGTSQGEKIRATSESLGIISIWDPSFDHPFLDDARPRSRIRDPVLPVEPRPGTGVPEGGRGIIKDKEAGGHTFENQWRAAEGRRRRGGGPKGRRPVFIAPQASFFWVTRGTHFPLGSIFLSDFDSIPEFL